MTWPRVAAVAGVLGSIGLAILVSSSPYADDKGELNQLLPLISCAFVVVGAWAHERRPDSRIGRQMAVVGFAWLGAGLIVAEQGWPYAIGSLLVLVPYVLIVRMLLGFPDGALKTRLDRGIFAVGVAMCTVLQATEVLIFDPEVQCPCDLPPRDNPLMIDRKDDLYEALVTLQSSVAVLVLLAVAWILFERRRQATTLQQHAMAPMLGIGVVISVALIFAVIGDITEKEAISDVAPALSRLAILSLPFAFVAGLFRTRLSRAMAVGSLVERLADRRPLRDELAEALEDPTLAVGYRVGDGYVDARGHEIVLEPGRHTLVEREGRAVGVLVHAPTDEPDALRAAAGAAALAIDNDRLVADLRTSRARMVKASDESRRRLERDLHDGAQQRLVALALTLRLARGRAEGEVAELLDEAGTELQHATDELRELARGIHPAVLTDRGLEPALRALAGRSPVPVAVDGVPEGRLPPTVESAAYFLVAEALTNVARYAQASEAHVRVERANGHVCVEVSDDGVGGADTASGSGLRGMLDRVSALDGTFSVVSPPGEGTVVRAELPCGS